MLSPSIGFTAAGLLLSGSGTATAPAKPFAVVVVRDGVANAQQIGETHSALRAGVELVGAKVIDDVTALDLMRLADSNGSCDETCERKMLAELPTASLLLGRLTTNTTHFALKVSVAGTTVSAAGPLSHLSDAGRQIGRRVASRPTGTIRIGGAAGVELFVDGQKVEQREVHVAAGRHVVRMGNGMGPRAIVRVDVPPGEIVQVAFPGGHGTSIVPLSVAEPPKSHRIGTKIRAGLATSYRTYSLSGSDGGGFDTSFVGSGPTLSGELAMGTPSLLIDVAYIDFFSKSRATFDGGSESSVAGGTRLDATVGGAWRFARTADGPSLAPAVGVSYQRHDAQDVRGLGVFIDHTLVSVDFSVTAELPLARVASVDATIGVSPWHSISEADQSLGANASAGVAPFWTIGGALPLSRTLELRASYAGEMRSIRHRGIASAPVDPDIRNARIDETIHSLTFSVHKEFR